PGGTALPAKIVIMDDIKKKDTAVKPQDQHATGTEEEGTVTTQDQHATGGGIGTLDQHATSEPFKPSA
ncbi:hypothetical protein ACFU76_20260, partial [Streptomyces sp. NPDC057539]